MLSKKKMRESNKEKLNEKMYLSTKMIKSLKKNILVVAIFIKKNTIKWNVVSRFLNINLMRKKKNPIEKNKCQKIKKKKPKNINREQVIHTLKMYL